MILSAAYKMMFAFDNIVQTMYDEYPAFFIGAHITDSLTQECTHVLVDQLRLVKEDIVDAIVSKKPIVLDSWIEVNYHEIS
jgi:hypothetical protein